MGRARGCGKVHRRQMAAVRRAEGRVGRVDSLSPAERSEIMSRVRSKNSRPELFVRKLVFALGYRSRLHAKELSGHPDIVFRKLRKVIFVHGCFWHRHAACALARLPKSRLDFWGLQGTGN